MKWIRKALDHLVPRIVREFFRTADGVSLITALGTVTAFTSGLPQVRFDKDDAASGTRYPALSTYVPAVNDRVLLLRVGNGWVVLGKVINS
jgi:hypothetical protein